LLYEITRKEFNLFMNKIYSFFILIFLPLLAIAEDKKINIVTKQIHKYECAINSSNIDNIMSL